MPDLSFQKEVRRGESQLLHTQVLLFLLSRKALFSYLINRITCLLRMAESSDELYFFF